MPPITYSASLGRYNNLQELVESYAANIGAKLTWIGQGFYTFPTAVIETPDGNTLAELTIIGNDLNIGRPDRKDGIRKARRAFSKFHKFVNKQSLTK